MKAIVLSGGYATRLRPISYALPKLLFPVLGKPMIYWTLDMLKKFSVDETILAVNYLADKLRDRVGDDYMGMRIRYSLERFPLGTAGPIKLASISTRIKDTFIAMNGDIITQISFSEMLKRHRESGAAITDALHRVNDPSRFGVVQLGSDNQILRFVEKPNLEEAPSGLINAGIYLIEPEVLKMIQKDRKVSLEREIFPALAKKNRLFGFPFRGNWFDIGDMADFRRANFTLLEQASAELVGRQRRRSINIREPTFLAGRSRVGREASVGPYVIAGQDVTIHDKAHVARSILFDGAQVGESSLVDGAILGSSVDVGSEVKIRKGSIISPHAKIEDGVTIGTGAIIHPYKEITTNIKPKANVM